LVDELEAKTSYKFIIQLVD